VDDSLSRVLKHHCPRFKVFLESVRTSGRQTERGRGGRGEMKREGGRASGGAKNVFFHPNTQSHTNTLTHSLTHARTHARTRPHGHALEHTTPAHSTPHCNTPHCRTHAHTHTHTHTHPCPTPTHTHTYTHTHPFIHPCRPTQRSAFSTTHRPGACLTRGTPSKWRGSCCTSALSKTSETGAVLACPVASAVLMDG
jgi:hypothetical protein